ncbi:MAG: ATPase, T2SS/T4P/T4SS family [Candidatus Heimdallarchaeaceae archaeon]|jgi:flagellar protein FlaI
MIEMNNRKSLLKEELESSTSISEYTVKGYKIGITRENNIIYYTAEPLFDFALNPLLFSELTSLVYKNKERLSKGILKFDELLETLKSICMWKILEIDNLSVNPDIFAELFIYRLVKLDRIMGLFLDDSVNEIYMDQKNSQIYLDHQYFGRCNTKIILEEEEIEGLLTRLKLEHAISISPKKPSLKVEFQTKCFHLRISMDFPPLSPNGPTFNIRKLKSNPLTLVDLINLGTLPPIIGAYLVEAVKQRRNITVIGEPNAGKTTLANAIDLYTPKNWRKIAIEDAIESIDQSSLGYKHLSIQVDSFESNKTNHTKTSEILKLLHRSPDWIYLGEIQSREHTQAMFEALNAGLKGIQTAHSDSIQKILRRWENLHKISPSDFQSLDIIIIMRRDITEFSFVRRVFEVYEVNKEFEEDSLNQNFLTRIYNVEQNSERIIKNIEEKSFLKEVCNSILKNSQEFQKNERLQGGEEIGY